MSRLGCNLWLRYYNNYEQLTAVWHYANNGTLHNGTVSEIKVGKQERERDAREGGTESRAHSHGLFNLNAS